MVGKNKFNQNGGNYESSWETSEAEDAIQFETYDNEKGYQSPKEISREAANRLVRMRARFRKLGNAAFVNA